jgi:hypothetical protein
LEDGGRSTKAIAAEIEARKSADALIIAEQGRWYTAIIQPLLALPVVIFMWKVIVWDKVLALSDVDGRARGALRGRAILHHGRRRESFKAPSRCTNSPCRSR